MDGFFSFCTWNLNTISKDNFYRVTLLEAHTSIYNYDIISLCETSLNESLKIDDNLLPGYTYVPGNNPDGSLNGGVGIFHKDTLPLRIRYDLSFSECLVAELNFGKKKIFFSVMYRNPADKANSLNFSIFLDNFKNLYENIKKENLFTCFFTGDFNGHTQSWYPDGDTNQGGVVLDDLFNDLNLNQLISEPTHFFRDDCLPSCIDLIVTDQPNLVVNSGVRPSLDPTVKHEIVFCRFNFKIPSPPGHHRKMWHFNRARQDLIIRAINNINWEDELQFLEDPTDQVNFFNECLLNIMNNFVPNEFKKICPKDPPWFGNAIKRIYRKQNILYRKYKNNGFKSDDRASLDAHRIICSQAVLNAKEKYLKEQGEKLANPNTAQKTYWKILNTFLNKCKIPRIPPLCVDNKFITDCKDKAKQFNLLFASMHSIYDRQCSA